uniref:Uncharacterized protein n=1 Tax=Arundo donax TaxID=35708 RepID=A0A0A8ZUR9_ARUDO
MVASLPARSADCVGLHANGCAERGLFIFVNRSPWGYFWFLWCFNIRCVQCEASFSGVDFNDEFGSYASCWLELEIRCNAQTKLRCISLNMSSVVSS